MHAYLLRRSVEIVPLLLGMSVILFFLLTLAPGDPIDLIVGSNPNIRPEHIERLKRVYGLDQPLPTRYVKWLVRTLQGDLGWSLSYKVPVADLIRQRLPNSLLLMTVGIAISLGIAIPVGILGALRQYSPFDYILSMGTFVGFSVPVFWFGLVMIYVFSVKLRLLPPGGLAASDVAGSLNVAVDRLRHLVMPAIVIGMYNMATVARYTRSSMLEVIKQDYVRTARSKGLAERAVLGRHAFRNAMLPIVTVMGFTLPTLFGGAPVTETVFSWPGIGHLLIHSVVSGDYLVALAILMMLAALVVLFNLLADIAYALLDPRVRYG